MHIHPILPEVAKYRAAAQLIDVLDVLYTGVSDEAEIYAVTKQAACQVVETMVAKDVPPPMAVQMLVAALMEMLALGLGPLGAAEHLRRMADALEAVGEGRPVPFEAQG